MAEPRERPGALETLQVMGSDLARQPGKTARNIRKSLYDGTIGFKEVATAIPREMIGFGKGFAKGYLWGQACTTASAYTNKIHEKIGMTNSVGGNILGILVSSTQDTMTGVGAAAYCCGTDNTLTKIAAGVAGAKVVSNVALGLFKWYKSAENRASQEEEN